MAADKEIRLVISGDGTVAIASMQKVGDASTQMNDKIASQSKGLVEMFKADWLAISAAVYGAIKVIGEAKEFLDLGAKAQAVESSFKIMATEVGVSADEMIAHMKRATQGTIDDSDLMQKATKLMLAGYDPSQIQRFSDVVIAASQYMGTSVSESFERISDSLATRMPKAMVQSGAITKEQMKIVTEAIAAGATQADLMNLAIENLRLKTLQLQGTQNQATISIQQHEAAMKNLKEEIGKGLIPVYEGLMTAAAKTMSVLKVIDDEILRQRADFISKIKALMGMVSAEGEGTNKVTFPISSITASTSDIAAQKAKVEAQVEALKKLKDTAAETKKLTDEWDILKKKLSEDINASGLDKFAAKISVVKDKAIEYEQKYESLAGTEVLIEKWKAAEIQKINVEMYQAIATLAKDEEGKILEREKSITEKSLSSWTAYREILLKTWEDAGKKAQTYYDQVKKIDDIVSHGKTFLQGLQPAMSPETQRDADLKALAATTKDAWSSAGDIDKFQKALTDTETFINKYKGTKDFLGFDYDITGLTNEYRKMLDNLGNLKVNAEQAGNAWTNFQNKEYDAIVAVDNQILSLKTKITDLDTQIFTVREFKVDTIKSQAALDSLLAKINLINQAMGNGASMAQSGEGIQTTMPSGYTNSSLNFTENSPNISKIFETSLTGEITQYSNKTPEEYAAQLGYPPVALGGYISKTGLALVHEGETVTPKGKGSGNVSITLGGITVQGVNNPEEMARLIVKPLERELRRLGTIH